MVSAAGAARPSYKTSDALFSRHPSVKFDGAANYFSLPGAIDAAQSLSGLTIAAVLSTTDSGLGKLVLGRAAGPGPFGFGLNAVANDGRFGFYVGANSAATQAISKNNENCGEVKSIIGVWQISPGLDAHGNVIPPGQVMLYVGGQPQKSVGQWLDPLDSDIQNPVVIGAQQQGAPNCNPPLPPPSNFLGFTLVPSSCGVER
jgi:hypothetical protein